MPPQENSVSDRIVTVRESMKIGPLKSFYWYKGAIASNLKQSTMPPEKEKSAPLSLFCFSMTDLSVYTTIGSGIRLVKECQVIEYRGNRK
ncbi:hypothetical protein AXI58_05085 [Bacillus nakamurai]|uniref:Uncharacterized protein n=1 Tax=Bacillus nakamurai TaxID=1793963 RepID=A0A150F2G1_9BACI|nr:hypothetical protein AXI58_05085 [Bacillus nakamurai]